MKNNRIIVNKILDKYKLKGNLSNMPIKIVSGALVLTMLVTALTGCSNSFDSYGDNYEDDTYYETDSNYDSDYGYESDYGHEEDYENYDFYFDESNYISKDQLQKILSKDFSVDASSLNSFKNFVSQIKVNYKHSDKFNIDGALSAYNKLNRNNNLSFDNIIKNNQVDFNDLYNIVKKNNSKFLSQQGEDGYYQKIDDSTLSDVVRYIVNTVNYNIKNNKNINLNVLDYKLSNLKVCEYNALGYAFYSHDEEILALNLSTIPKTSINNVTALEENVIHEINHLLQDTYAKRDNNIEQNYGFCYQFKNVDLNSLYWVWFVEAAAQRNTLKQAGINFKDSSTYDAAVLTLDSLNATSAFMKNDVDLGHLTTKNDLNELFNYFGCNSEEDKKEILRLMVANNLLLEPYDIIYSESFYEKMPNLDSYTYGKELKNSIGQTQTKIFYRNLAEKIKNKTIKLEDVFSLISVFETELSRNIGYASYENCDYLDGFYKNYTLIQEEFFELVANSLGISIDDVFSYYFSYHNVMDQSNFNNQLLNNEQKEFYLNLYKNGRDCKNPTIIEVYGQMKQNKK